MKIRNIIALPCILATVIGSTACSKNKTNTGGDYNINRDSMEIVQHNDSVIKVYESIVGKNAIDVLNTLKITSSNAKKTATTKHNTSKDNLEIMKDSKDIVNENGLKYELRKDSNGIEHCYIIETSRSKNNPKVIASDGILF